MQGFHKLGREARLARLGRFAELTSDELSVLSGERAVDPALAEHFIENVIGYYPLPLGVATHFRIDGQDLMIPMAVEETSIIAAASATAKWVKEQGTIRTYVKGRLIIGQIEIPSVKNLEYAAKILADNRTDLIELANMFIPGLVRRGGGVRDIAIREIGPSWDDRTLVLHILCDPCDAMGANLINQVCEGLKPRVEELTGEKVGLCILSNLVDGRLAGAEVIIRNIDPAIGSGIEAAARFAELDPYRAATHNKGTLNGIDPILIVTGNDWRAVEAGVHAYASRSGSYKPITQWKMNGKDLVGTIEIPLSLGIVGGVTSLHPFSKIALKILNVKRADDLARICVAVGLVQNLGALRALSTVGIVKGHMALHAANLAIAAGAEKHEMIELKNQLHQILNTEKFISLTRAKEVLESMRGRATI